MKRTIRAWGLWDKSARCWAMFGGSDGEPPFHVGRFLTRASVRKAKDRAEDGYNLTPRRFSDGPPSKRRKGGRS